MDKAIIIPREILSKHLKVRIELVFFLAINKNNSNSITHSHKCFTICIPSITINKQISKYLL